MMSAHAPDPLDAIAIIGMVGRFPGAKTVEAFWRNLRDGVESISFFTDQEIETWEGDTAVLRDPNYVKAQPVLDDIEMFDAAFFKINPREAEVMDPQHRLFLECAWEGLESAGYDPETYAGRIGVYAGAEMNLYLLRNILSNRALWSSLGSVQLETVSDKDYLTTRISHKLNLTGPSIAVQTACSTSLVAVHLACESLLNSECDMALAGGVTARVPQRTGYLFKDGGILSPDGHCRAFDAQAQGSIFGSGVGVVVLKRLADALADGDSIHAVIKGSAVTNDGSLKVGYTAPSVEGQARAIADALAVAGVDPETISYIEAHGSGTPLGDTVEVAALNRVFRACTHKRGFCAIGSVKTNIGHLSAAAGVAGLIKTVLALKHKQIPPSLNFERPNPQIDFDSSPFYVNRTLREWTTDGHPRRAGVSSFGLGGTNAHVVLEEAPAAEPSGLSRPYQLLLLSARTETALERMTDNLASHLQMNPDLKLADVAYTLQVGRRPFNQRRMVVCRNVDEAVDALTAQDSLQMLTAFHQADAQRVSVAFLFPGVGDQYAGMGRGLYRDEIVFREQIDRCAELALPHLGLDLRTVLFPDEEADGEETSASRAIDLRQMLGRDTPGGSTATEKLYGTGMAQVAVFVFEYAVARLLMSWGIEPQAMLGYSLGEYTAACLAGVFSLEDGVRVVLERARLIETLPEGAMLAVALSHEAVAPLLSDALSLSIINAPQMCVVAGPSEDVARLRQALTERGVSSRDLRISHAFHSQMMMPIANEFARFMHKVRLNRPQVPFVSNVSGRWIRPEEAIDPTYWAKHLCQTVQFSAGVKELLKRPGQVLVEVGPGQSLGSFVLQHPDCDAGQATRVLSTVRHAYDRQPDGAFLLKTLGQLWLAQVEIDWKGFYRHERRRRLALPGYPFERQRYWVEPARPPEQMGTQADAAPARREITQWFYIPSWKRSMPPAQSSESLKGCWLLFSSEERLPVEMRRQLQIRGSRVVTVLAGDRFMAADDTTYVIRPAHRDDYTALLTALAERDQMPAGIVHLWNLSSPEESVADFAAEELEHSFYSLLFLAQALAEQNRESDLQLIVVSTDLHQVTGDEKIHPEKATLLGPCKVIPQEMPQVTCRSIDIVLPQAGSRQEGWLIEQLVAELASNSQDAIVAYRGRNRWVMTYESAPLAPVEGPAHLLREEGVYLITGGLGGIGLMLADHLARTVQARLILTSRSRFPEPEDRERWLATHDAHDQTSQRVRAIQKLEESGTEVLVLQADVGDQAQMEAAIRAATERFGAIHGVIHAAGLPGGGIIHSKTAEEAARVLSPKVQGMRVLEAALRDMPLDFMLLCSSGLAILGGPGQVDYCAANAFLDAYAQACSERERPIIVSINWDRWGEVGMGADRLSGRSTTSDFRPEPAHETFKVDHPLLKSFYQEAGGRTVYPIEINADEHWVLSEHKLMGIPTLPGTTYLELARAVVAERTANAPLEIREATFFAPLMVTEGSRKTAQFVLEEKADGFEFRVISRPEAASSGEPQWHVHAAGQVRRLEEVAPQYYDVPAIQARCVVSEMAIDDARIETGDLAGEILQSGPRWRNLKRVYIGHDECIARLELDEAFWSDVETFNLHPALLHNATGAVAATLSGDGRYLPLSYERVRIYGRLPPKFYSHIRLAPGSTLSGESVTVQATLIDEQGYGVVEIEALVLRRVGESAAAHLRALAEEGRADTIQPSSPASQRRSGHTILSHEGLEVFQRILCRNRSPQIAVFTRHLPALIRQASEFAKGRLRPWATEVETLSAERQRRVLNPYVAPRNDIEEKLADIWQQFLGINPIGIHDNFFELGGNSLLAIQVKSRVRDSFRVELPLHSFFDAPTVAGLAQIIAAVSSTEPPAPDSTLIPYAGLKDIEL